MLIKGVLKRPGEPAAISETENTLEGIRAVVGGPLEMIRFSVQVDGRERVLDLYFSPSDGPPHIAQPRNCAVLLDLHFRPFRENIPGNVFVASSEADEAISLSDGEAAAAVDALGALAEWLTLAGLLRG